jgi:hypothetical protein
MEVSDHLHTLASLPPGKESPAPIGQETGWVSEPVWTRWRRDETASLSLPVIDLVTIPTELPRLLPKCIKIKIYIPLSLAVPLYGGESWTFTLK